MNLSIQQIQYILKVAEIKNFSKAAEACFVTQPTLSMQIKKAEEEIGLKIFNRDYKEVNVTKAAEKLIPILYEMLIDFEKIEKFKQSMAGEVKEELIIGIIPTVASYLVPELFKLQSKNDFPYSVKCVELKSKDLLAQVEQRKVHIGILSGPIQEEDLEVKLLFNEEMFVYTSSTKPKQTDWDMEELKSLKPWLLTGGNCLRSQMMEFCSIEKNNQENSWTYEGGNLEILIRMIELHGGYTLIPQFYAQNYLKTKQLSSVKNSANATYPARSIVGVMKSKFTHHEGIQHVIKHIKSNFIHYEQKQFEFLAWK